MSANTNLFFLENWAGTSRIIVEAGSVELVYAHLTEFLCTIPYKVIPVVNRAIEAKDVLGSLPEKKEVILKRLIEDQGLKAFDAYEISLVAEYENGGCEVVEKPDDEASNHFWTLYGHIPDEGVTAIGDTRTRNFALELYQRITGSSAPLTVNGPEVDPLDGDAKEA